MNLSSPIEKVKGVGPKTAEQLRAAGLLTVGDIISFLPRKHEDFSEVVSISDIRPGKQTIKARVEKVDTRRVRRGMQVTTAVLVDKSGKLNAVWFNQVYRARQFVEHEEFYFSGEFEFRFNRYQLTNPSAEKVKDVSVSISAGRLMPVYKAVKGLKSQLVRKIILELRPLISLLPETLPPELVKNQRLVSRSAAFYGLHFPKTTNEIAKARERLAFEELFQLILASQLNKNQNASLKGWPILFDQAAVREFVAALPFQLTSGQRIAAWDILQDFEKQAPMNRLLQGDVGSGKTVVAGIAMRQAVKAGFQSALMAPTEILARQHAETLLRLFEPFHINVGLLTGSVKGKARQQLLERIKSGEVDVVVGTHTLIQDTAVFKKLGFVVIDEQHRFGVEQRQKLLMKSDRPPHLLAMTATPIPRSLQLTVFGELDISVLSELPKNRLAIKTKLIAPTSRAAMYQAIDHEIVQGHQAYVVAPLIDETAASDKTSVEAEYKKLKNSVFGHRRIGLLHGRMKQIEKDKVMSDFKKGDVDVLVSTTVVEVGVDVPNATIILIENADHFGLAQLHQLRGRVGRGLHQSYCYLALSDSKKPSQRLREIERSNDGFYLADVDLRLRGPGEVYGRMQHGELNLQIASFEDTTMIARAQKEAHVWAKRSKDLLQYKALMNDVEKYQRVTTLN